MDVGLSFAIWIPSLPILVLCIVGMVFAAKKLTSQRRAMLFAQLGFGALILRTLVSIGSQQMIMVMRYAVAHDGIASMASQLAVVNSVAYLLMLAGVFFLGMSIFADR